MEKFLKGSVRTLKIKLNSISNTTGDTRIFQRGNVELVPRSMSLIQANTVQS